MISKASPTAKASAGQKERLGKASGTADKREKIALVKMVVGDTEGLRSCSQHHIPLHSLPGFPSNVSYWMPGLERMASGCSCTETPQEPHQ